MALIPDELYKVVSFMHTVDADILSSMCVVVLVSEHYFKLWLHMFLSQQRRIAEDNIQELLKAINNVQRISRQLHQ